MLEAFCDAGQKEVIEGWVSVGCSLPGWRVIEMKFRVLMGLEKNQTSDEAGAGAQSRRPIRKV